MRILRVLIGYALAAFGAGFAISALAFSPGSLDAAIDKAPEIFEKAWNSSPFMGTVIAVLGAIPALIAVQYAEHHKIRSWTYYALLSAAVGIAAYWLAHATETVPTKSDVNLYSTIAFGLAGLVFGTLYWIFSGRHAGMGAAIQQPAVKPQVAAMKSKPVDMKVKTENKPATKVEVKDPPKGGPGGGSSMKPDTKKLA